MPFLLDQSVGVRMDGLMKLFLDGQQLIVLVKGTQAPSAPRLIKGRLDQKARRAQTRTRLSPSPKSRWWKCLKTEQNVLVALPPPSVFSSFLLSFFSPFLLLSLCLHISDDSSVVRKSIARVLTVLTSQQRTALRQFYRGKKHLPLDLRAKKTRAQVSTFILTVINFQRRALSKEDASRITLRTKKILQAYPQQKYALRA
jgi:hypothetical protein